MDCHACGAPLNPGARYCPKCGAKVDAAKAADWRVGLPWAVAGAAVGALVVVLALRVGGRPHGPAPAHGPPPLTAGAGPPPRPPPPAHMQPGCPRRRGPRA